MSPKTLRGFLRREFPRHRGDHGSAWSLTKDQVAAVRHRFGRGAPRIAPRRKVVAPVAPTEATPPQHTVIARRPLRCYVRPGLDVLFVALNPPPQSAGNGHWFSGEQSAFFKLLYQSGLIISPVPKATADEIVFGGNEFNYKGASYGVTDLHPHLIEVNSGKVRLERDHVDEFIRQVYENQPRIVCMIHQKVWTAFNKSMRWREDVVDLAVVGKFTQPLADCASRFICNYFPNGNSITDQVKIDIFKQVRALM